MALQLLIFGASGISGLAVIREAFKYPTPSTFTKIIGLTHRPLSLADAQIPADARVVFYSGVDLTKGEEPTVAKLLAIPSISSTTHVAFLASLPATSNGSNPSALAELNRANVSILQTAITAIEALAPLLQHITIQTGANAYGAEYIGSAPIPWSAPLKESAPRAPEPYASQIFHYAQLDAVTALSAGKAWRWTDIRPGAVVGFAPRAGSMDLAAALAVWLSLYRWEHPEWSEVVFPGSDAVWTARHTHTSQAVLGRSHLYALVGGEAGGRTVNVGDGTGSWSEGLWGEVCAWFGLKGVGPREGVVTGEEWVVEQRGRWAEYEGVTGLREGTIARAADGMWFMSLLLVGAAVDRHYDLTLSQELGFPQSRDGAEGYHVAFGRLRRGKRIPLG